MSGATLPRLIEGSYRPAVAFHTGIILLVGIWAVVSAASYGATANAARETGFLTAMIFLTRLLVALPSGVAVLSWWLCRRRGWTPSLGHKGLTVTLAVAMILLLVGGLVS